MLCTICKEKPATVHLTQIVGDKMQKLDLCEDCAKAKGVNDPGSFALADLMLGLGASQEIEQAGGGVETKCPRCGFTQADFKKSGRLGCPECYRTFAEPLGASALGQVVEITNCSNPGVGHLYRYENRAFNAFVRELHRRLLPFRSGVKFRTGHALYYWLAVVAAIVCAIYAPGKIDSEYHGLERSSHHIYNWVAAAGFAYAARRLRPRSYPPEDIPKKILPPEKDHRTLMQQW